MPVTIVNPNSANVADGQINANVIGGKQGEQLVSELHGKFFSANLRKNVYKANVAAVTVPANAATLVSVFGLYNPPGSGVVAEIITTEVGAVVVASVVNVLGWYFSNATQSATATFTTLGVANTNLFSGRVGDTPANAVRFYSAVTHVGTPVLVDLVASWQAVTDTAIIPCAIKNHDGALILPPGILMSLAMSTAAGVTNGMDLGVTWAEWPYVS